MEIRVEIQKKWKAKNKINLIYTEAILFLGIHWWRLLAHNRNDCMDPYFIPGQFTVAKF